MLAVGAGDGGRSDELVIAGEVEGLDWGVEADVAGDETRVIGGIGWDGWLETEVKEDECGARKNADEDIANGLHRPIQRINFI